MSIAPDKLRWGILITAAAILSYQLFLPPIVGLADQGDFIRIIGRFGYRGADSSSQYAFLTRKFVADPSARVPAYEQVTSEYLFVAPAVLLNQLVSRDGKLDLTVIGLVHLLAFLYAFYRLMKVTASVRAGPLLWLIALIILTDVGYAAYWNSFYAEPASCIFFLLLLAESIAICLSPEVSSAQIGRWTLWAILLVFAKAQNAPLGILLALFALRLRAWSKWPQTGRIAVAGSLLIAIAAALNLATIPLPVQWPDTYNQVFLAILPESKTPAQDARALKLGADWLKYSGTGAWSPGSGYPIAVATGTIGKTITPAGIIHFYMLHPSRLWRHAKRVLPVAFSLRPEWCGNFERSAGLPPDTRSQAFSLWSSTRQRMLRPVGKFVLIVLLICPVASLFAWLGPRKRRRSLEFFSLLSICCLSSFMAAICGDAWDNTKHLFLFNLLLDVWMVGWLIVLAGSIRNLLYRI